MNRDYYLLSLELYVQNLLFEKGHRLIKAQLEWDESQGCILYCYNPDISTKKDGWVIIFEQGIPDKKQIDEYIAETEFDMFDVTKDEFEQKYKVKILSSDSIGSVNTDKDLFVKNVIHNVAKKQGVDFKHSTIDVIEQFAEDQYVSMNKGFGDIDDVVKHFLKQENDNNK
jgi:hypothetical protein